MTYWRNLLRTMMMRWIVAFVFLLYPLSAVAGQDDGAVYKAQSVLVDKSDAKLYLIADGKVFREYKVVFGANPVGHKQQEGDARTPEGDYILDYKKEDSSFYKAIHISYPNEQDIARAKARGVDPGGQIMIHGQKNGYGWMSFYKQRYNWTNGCIAVKNSDMDEIWDFVDVGTPITIRP